jgi:L,D-transpeptidase ErfK/SrfK
LRRSRRGAALTLPAILAALASGPAAAAEYPLLPATTAVGAVASDVTRLGDTLPDVARRHDLGYTQLVAANRGVDPWVPGVTRLLLPSFYLLPDAPHRGIVINLAEERLYFYLPGGRAVITFPVGIAVDGKTTPLGTTRILAKQARPTWFPPASIHAERPWLPAAIPPGPDDPLGAYALFLGWPGYLIHGTNKPDSVGRLVSHGCLHLYPEDIAELYRLVPVGTAVTVVDEPVKLQWVGAALFAEIHPSIAQDAALETGDAPPAAMPAGLRARVEAALGDHPATVDWPAVERAGSARNGVPVQIASR